MNLEIKQTVIGLVILIIIIILLIISVIASFKKEGYNPYYNPLSTRNLYNPYWYNYPSRYTRNMIYDIRGDPYCPNFGKCGNRLRSNYNNNNYNIPRVQPRFNHTRHYDVDGILKKHSDTDIKMYPHQPWNQPIWMPHHHMMGYYAY
jgi:hypothetical protein